MLGYILLSPIVAICLYMVIVSICDAIKHWNDPDYPP
jgi:hypothetical protein